MIPVLTAQGCVIIPTNGKAPTVAWTTATPLPPDKLATLLSRAADPSNKTGAAAVLPATVLVCDLDSKAAQDKLEDLTGETIQDLALHTPVVRSGRAPVKEADGSTTHGYHVYFEVPQTSLGGKRLRCGTGVLAPGFDVKTKGGIIIIPPSTHVSTSKPYEAISAPGQKLDIIPPLLLAELLKTAVERPPVPPTAFKDLDRRKEVEALAAKNTFRRLSPPGTELSDQTISIVASMEDPTLPSAGTVADPLPAVGERNDTVYRWALCLARQGLGPVEIWKRLEATIEALIALDENGGAALREEYRSTVTSATRAISIHREMELYSLDSYGLGNAFVDLLDGEVKYIPNYGTVKLNRSTGSWDLIIPEAAGHVLGADLAAYWTAAIKPVLPQLNKEQTAKFKAMLSKAESAEAVRKELIPKLADASSGALLQSSETNAATDFLPTKEGLMYLPTRTILKPDKNLPVFTVTSSICYDKDAKAPLWDKFITEAIPEPDKRDYFHRLVGMIMLGDVSNQCYHIIAGDPGTGKSTFTFVLRQLLSGLYGAAKPSVFSSLRLGQSADSSETEKNMYMLFGKRLAILSETQAGMHINTGLINAITGQDEVIAKKLYKDGFSYVPTFNLLWVTNYLPSVSDDATYRRLRVFYFNHCPDEPDENLRAKLMLELPGILNWALDGVSKFLADKRKLWLPACMSIEAVSRLVTTDWRTRFISERLDFMQMSDILRLKDIDTSLPKLTAEHHRGYKIEKSALRLALFEWLESEGISADKGAAWQQFSRALSDEGVFTSQKNNGRFLLGCRLKPEAIAMYSDILE